MGWGRFFSGRKGDTEPVASDDGSSAAEAPAPVFLLPDQVVGRVPAGFRFPSIGPGRAQRVSNAAANATGLRTKPRLIAITGGPGAGKTTLLKAALSQFSDQVTVMPEAASLLHEGGFPYPTSDVSRRARQQAVFQVQLELERSAQEDSAVDMVLCDRGTVDCIGFWPDEASLFWQTVNSSKDEQLSRYYAVIHLCTPPAWSGYDRHSNPNRLESASEARRVDEQLERAWAGHPLRFMVTWDEDFVAKLSLALALIRNLLPVSRHAAARFARATRSLPLAEISRTGS